VDVKLISRIKGKEKVLAFLNRVPRKMHDPKKVNQQEAEVSYNEQFRDLRYTSNIKF
jgi:hypothetical protein